MSSHPLLEVHHLCTEFRTEAGLLRAVDDVSFSLNPSEMVGLVGESGVGKTVAALSVLRLVPDPPGRIVAGRILFDGQDLLTKSAQEMCGIRGHHIAMVFQEPMTALNPVLRVGEQVAEVFRLHQGLARGAAQERTVELLAQVGLSAPSERYQAYPHQLSGGMRQRIVLAIALAGEPRLLLADEPTTALDVTTQAQVMAFLAAYRRQHQLSILLITHDLALVAQHCDRVLVLYAGQVVEEGPTKSLFCAPAHPYTAALLRAVRSLTASQGLPEEIPGHPPDLRRLPKGCRFAGRCPQVQEICQQTRPELSDVGTNGNMRRVRCLFPLSEDSP